MKDSGKNIITKACNSLKTEGVTGCMVRTKRYVKKRIEENRKYESVFKDVLFVSGCNEDLPHPWRYRVTHQREQLEAYNYSTDEVYYQNLKLEQVSNYRAFVIFRCPYTEVLGAFVQKAKELNKKVIYDIDDLVIDTKYTNLIEYVQSMSAEDKAAYDANVMNMQRMLKNCDFALTSTSCLAEELRSYLSNVYINRNTASEEMVQLSEEALKNVQKNKSVVKIGYFSGSITHNEDFELIRPVILKVLEKYQNVELYLAGELDLPVELQKFHGKIKKLPFVDWRRLPAIISEMDINLAPLKDTIFNRAKSENKWVEAALVKVVTVASDVGAFKECIETGRTGILCKTEEEWEAALENLIQDQEYREKIAEYAYQHCLKNCTTINHAFELSQIMEKEITANYGFVLPGLEISGGIKVALKHACMLQKAGKDVTIFSLSGDNGWCEFEGRHFPVISMEKSNVVGKVQQMIATMWTTVKVIEEYPNAIRKCYLVQNFETDFYKVGNPLRIEANRSYKPKGNVEFLTISKWCQSWLKENYDQDSLYAPNGLDIDNFCCRKRTMSGKIKILIEGDCAVDYKNVDEAFEIANGLDRTQYEVWYMSYNAEPKLWYKVDKFYHKVPYHKVAEIYGACDILLKTSLLESFSYPPLEMMASGGYVVAVPNGGNVEYMKDGVNCMFYEAGNISQAQGIIEKIRMDKSLQSKLYSNGCDTAKRRDWDNVEKEILKLYGV